jgi:hypothetical protein
LEIVDYSIIVGFDDDTREIVVGIIDYMRQYDIIKKLEKAGKSLTMIAGQAAPTITTPIQYKERFQNAMERYFMNVMDIWSVSDVNDRRTLATRLQHQERETHDLRPKQEEEQEQEAEEQEA